MTLEDNKNILEQITANALNKARGVKVESNLAGEPINTHYSEKMSSLDMGIKQLDDFADNILEQEGKIINDLRIEFSRELDFLQIRDKDFNSEYQSDKFLLVHEMIKLKIKKLIEIPDLAFAKEVIFDIFQNEKETGIMKLSKSIQKQYAGEIILFILKQKELQFSRKLTDFINNLLEYTNHQNHFNCHHLSLKILLSSDFKYLSSDRYIIAMIDKLTDYITTEELTRTSHSINKSVLFLFVDQYYSTRTDNKTVVKLLAKSHPSTLLIGKNNSWQMFEHKLINPPAELLKELHIKLHQVGIYENKLIKYSYIIRDFFTS